MKTNLVTYETKSGLEFWIGEGTMFSKDKRQAQPIRLRRDAERILRGMKVGAEDWFRFSIIQSTELPGFYRKESL